MIDFSWFARQEDSKQRSLPGEEGQSCAIIGSLLAITEAHRDPGWGKSNVEWARDL